MSFTKKTWVNRAVEYPGRRRLTSVSTDVYDITREEGSISAEGDAFNATTMNDLENRIEAGFTAAAIVSGSSFTIPVNTAFSANAAQSWDSEGEFLYHYDVTIENVTANSAVYNPIFNTAALDILAPYLETGAGYIRLYFNEATASAAINCSSYEVRY
ncbi:MAG: hypothetical protein IKF05_07775 [Erysipelotrichaceae bacterium]|nr:hypothetical protein [Erysipelotrichaceae bacterium]